MESAKRLLNGCVPSSDEDHVQHHCRGSSIRHVVEFVMTAAVARRDNILRCETDDSSTCFDIHRGVMCMGCALEIVYGLQHQQRFTLFFFKF